MTTKTTQYAKTTSPEVLAALKTRDAEYKEFFGLLRAWAEERGIKDPRYHRVDDRLSASAPLDRPEGFGQWTKPGRYGSVPFKSNTAEKEAWPRQTLTPIPGAGVVESEPDRNGGWRTGLPAVFAHEGTAYRIYSFAPVTPEPEESPWEECLGSEAMAAREAVSSR